MKYQKSGPFVDRRAFIQTVSSGGAVAGTGWGALPQTPILSKLPAGGQPVQSGEVVPLDLKPAQWIWYPSQRCLQNTFLLFRRTLEIPFPLRRAYGWILADSRYLLTVNGRRIQWGPAPHDPRWPEADPLDLTSAFRSGRNCLGCQVLFYGQGDGTWPMGKAGFLFHLGLESEDGRQISVVSDSQWQVHLARSWKPGHYKRWYLRSLQEEFDARKYPYGWDLAETEVNEDWLPAMALSGPADEPSVCNGYSEYMLEIAGKKEVCSIRPRSIPMMREYDVPVKGLVESYRIRWKRPVEEYFECLPPESFQAEASSFAAETGKGEWTLDLEDSRTSALTFEWEEQVVGWPFFQIEAPEGTIVEILVHEAHQPGGPPLLNSHFNSWTRFICRAGINRFQTFDYESLRWMQIHIHGAAGRIRVWDIGVHRRIYPWPHRPEIDSSEPALNRLFSASINTLHNCAQDILVDGMARERQQYSGDCGHQLHAIFSTFGEWRQGARYLQTYSQGMTLDGYFLDCWPAYDRLARLMERQMQLTGWGPILDHGIGFNFDCYYYWLYTGDRNALQEPYPRLLRFLSYLESIRGQDGLLPVVDIGVPSVWLDHVAYRQQRHKQCAFNLYAAAMLENALVPICRAFQDEKNALRASAFGRELLQSCIRMFWDESLGLFVVNRPWLREEKERRLCDRSLATAVLFDQCPGGRMQPSVQALSDCPAEMGISYPANAGWRLWALCKGRRSDVVLQDLRQRWATMPSVLLNNSLQEDWTVRTDAGSQWSHCPVVPLYILYMGIAGIIPLTPGFDRYRLQPQIGDLEKLDLTAWTVKGPLRFHAKGRWGDRRLILELPNNCEGELYLDAREQPSLEPSTAARVTDRWLGQIGSPLRAYRLPMGQEVTLQLKYT